MSKLIIFKGKRGTGNVNGLNGLGTSDVSAEPLDSPIYNALLTNSLSKVGTINFDRGSQASHNNRHHKNVWARGSSTTNYITYSEDFAQWADTFSRWSIIGATADPFGGSDATEINLDADTSGLAGVGEVLELTLSSIPQGGNLTFDLWIKVISGTVSGLQFGDGVNNHDMITPTTSYQRISKTVNSLSSSFILSLNPRGLTGARIAIYGVQLEDNNSPTTYIPTVGAVVTVPFIGEIERESDKGWLIESQKENLVKFSGDLSKWTPLNSTIDTYTGLDPFGVTGESIRLVWGSIAEITITGQTNTISASTGYTVSFWAYLTAGSIFELSVTLGGGVSAAFGNPSTTGFQRISVLCTSGTLNTDIVITANSQNLTASLNISGVQIEEGELSTYIKTGTLKQTRLADIVTAPYAYNIPAPALPWSFIFQHSTVLDSTTIKTVFTNGQSGADEFSCYFQDKLLHLKNGSTSVSVTALSYNTIAITFDGSTVRIYNQSTLIKESAVTPSTSVPSFLYIGMNSTAQNSINGHISKFKFYDKQLNTNELLYLMGV
jgi:hypothetical protein